MNDCGEFIAGFVGLLAVALGLVVLGSITSEKTRVKMEKEAIANGVAEYKVNDEGLVTFHYLTCTNCVKEVEKEK